MKEFIIEQKDSGQRIDKYLLRIMPEAGKSFLYKMMRKKNIVINDKKIEGNEILCKGDSVKVWFSDETFEKFAGKTDSIDIKEYLRAYEILKGIEVIYEDENYLIVNKPVNVLSQKSDAKDLSLNEWIIGYCLKNQSVSPDSLKISKPSIVNRLDRNTSGLVLAGKNVFGLNTLGRLVKEREVSKYYLTYVWGKMEGSRILEGYHLKNNDENIVSIITAEEYKRLDAKKQSSYYHVKTGYKVLSNEQIIIDGKPRDITRLEIDLITGKSHQIRAHLSSVGHSLLGDNKYGASELNKKLNMKFQQLHAYRLVFKENPELGELSGREIICQPSNQEDLEARFLKN